MKTALQITDTYLRSLQVSNQIQKIQINAGLELWVRPSGKKIWYLLCVDVNGTRWNVKIGTYPHISLSDAIHRSETTHTIGKNNHLRIIQQSKCKDKIDLKSKDSNTSKSKQIFSVNMNLLNKFHNKYNNIYSLIIKKQYESFKIEQAYEIAREILELFKMRNDLVIKIKYDRNANDRMEIIRSIKEYDLNNQQLFDFLSRVKKDPRYLARRKIANSHVIRDRVGSKTSQVHTAIFTQHAKNQSQQPSRENLDLSLNNTSKLTQPVFVFSGVLTQVKDYKIPDEWVHTGSALYPDLSNDNGRLLAIRLGIDFGTAYTKVAYLIADKVHFVQWSGIRNTTDENRFFLPGEMSIENNGAVVLGRYSDESCILNNLKKPFLDDKPGEGNDFAPVITFIAWILKYTRAWIYKNHAAIIDKRKLAYEINFGKPSSKASWKHDKLYEKIIYSAWILSQYRDENMNLNNAQDIFEQDIDSKEIGLDHLALVPEFAAQITGYTQSPQREKDLHMFFDIGAGTIDISLFNLTPFKDEGERFYIFTSDVEPFGTHFLMQQRIQNTNIQIIWNDHQLSMSHEEFANYFCINLHEIQKNDSLFLKNVKSILYKNLHYTKKERYPDSPSWFGGIRTFIAGGGSNCALYSLALQRAFEDMRVKCLRMNSSYFDSEIGMGSEYSQRLSVAYGLTFDASTIGTIIPPDSIPNIHHNTVPQAQNPLADRMHELYS